MEKSNYSQYITYIVISITILFLLSFSFNNIEKENKKIFSKNIFEYSDNFCFISDEDPPCYKVYYYIEYYSKKYNIPKKYMYGIAFQETKYKGPTDYDYNPFLESGSGAVGPMQVMLSTAKRINKNSNITKNKLKHDIKLNVKSSAKLIRKLYDKYGDWKIVFGCYNTGKPCVNGYAINVYNFNGYDS